MSRNATQIQFRMNAKNNQDRKRPHAPQFAMTRLPFWQYPFPRERKQVRLPNHPETILKQEFLDPMEITQYRLTKDIGVDRTRINQNLKGERSTSADTALRLSTYLGLSDRYWLNAQTLYDIK